MVENKTVEINNTITLSDLYVQNWEHVRHVENERMGFTSVYFVILAAAIGFAAQTNLTLPFILAILGFLLLLSIIGFLISIRLKADMEAHGKCLHNIAYASGLENFFTFGAEKGWTTKIQLRWMFPILYLLLCSFFVFLIIMIIITPSFIENLNSSINPQLTQYLLKEK